MNALNILVRGPEKDQVAEMEIFVEGTIAPVALAEAASMATTGVKGVTRGRADFGAITEHREASSAYKFGTAIRLTFDPPVPTTKAQSIAGGVEMALVNLGAIPRGNV